MTAAEIQFIDTAIHDLGFDNVYAFAKQQLIAYYEERVAHYREQIAHYEQKYNTNYDTFIVQPLLPEDPKHFEIEDDGMDWEFYELLAAQALNKINMLQIWKR